MTWHLAYHIICLTHHLPKLEDQPSLQLFNPHVSFYFCGMRSFQIGHAHIDSLQKSGDQMQPWGHAGHLRQDFCVCLN